MLIILEKDHQGLGKKGDVKDVKKGYALNYLLPNSIASIATEKRVLKLAALIEAQKDQQVKVAEKAGELQKELEGKTFEMKENATKEGKLYGSVSENTVLEVIKEATGHELTVDNIKMDTVKELGEYKITLSFTKDVETEITINVIKS